MSCDLQVLLSKGVDEGKILFLSLIAAPEGIHRICSAFPRVKLITSEIDEGIGPGYQVVPGKCTYMGALAYIWDGMHSRRGALGSTHTHSIFVCPEE